MTSLPRALSLGAAGVPVYGVAARLGHADPSVTLKVYAHVIPWQATEVVDRFANLIDHDAGGTDEHGDETEEGR